MRRKCLCRYFPSKAFFFILFSLNRKTDPEGARSYPKNRDIATSDKEFRF
jgi:hypothetical protein